MIHYIYTMFYQTSTTGEPIVRAMWFDFRDEENLIGLDNQFMWGEHILVCPKIGAAFDDDMFMVDCIFPAGAQWFEWFSKSRVDYSGTTQQLILNDD